MGRHPCLHCPRALQYALVCEVGLWLCGLWPCRLLLDLPKEEKKLVGL